MLVIKWVSIFQKWGASWGTLSFKPFPTFQGRNLDRGWPLDMDKTVDEGQSEPVNMLWCVCTILSQWTSSVQFCWEADVACALDLPINISVYSYISYTKIFLGVACFSWEGGARRSSWKRACPFLENADTYGHPLYQIPWRRKMYSNS